VFRHPSKQDHNTEPPAICFLQMKKSRASPSNTANAFPKRTPMLDSLLPSTIGKIMRKAGKIRCRNRSHMPHHNNKKYVSHFSTYPEHASRITNPNKMSPMTFKEDYVKAIKMPSIRRKYRPGCITSNIPQRPHHQNDLQWVVSIIISALDIVSEDPAINFTNEETNQ
jgi:hypothetical protein